MIQSGRSPGGSTGATWNAGGSAVASAVASKDSAERRRSPFAFCMTSSGPRNVHVAFSTLPSARSAPFTVAWATVQEPSRAVTLFARTGAATAASAKPASAATTALPLTMIMSCAASDPILSSPADIQEISPALGSASRFPITTREFAADVQYRDLSEGEARHRWRPGPHDAPQPSGQLPRLPTRVRGAPALLRHRQRAI